MELSLFEEVAEVVRGLLPDDLGALRCRCRRYGVKVWFGAEQPAKEHYEAQIIGASAVDGASVLAIEVGFHAEHPGAAANDAVISRLAAREEYWRSDLGAEAEVGAFLGRAESWRRISETWPDPDLSDTEIGFELGARLADYIIALERIRR
ncbi:MAG: hypothetical protein QOG64_3188 [Acidimicrobiaceae bacterium]|nr:hypothetical protein [Acidimicrobiaceae bacterium]